MKKWIFLLRSFFPKWKFFDDVGPELRLEVCYGKNETTLSPWENALTPIKRSLQNLIVNPAGNYLHACHNHLNHFNAEITAFDEASSKSVTDLATYQITKELANFQIVQRELIERPFYFQFRILVAYSENETRAADVVLTSPVYEVV